jgi:annexin A7/11
MGTDEVAINNVLGSRSAAQRLKISLMFKTMYGKDMTKDIKSETSGHYKGLLVALLNDRPHYDAKCLRSAMKGAGTDEQVLIETLCTRTNAQIREIKDAYTELFKRDLEKDIVSETSGHFKRLLVSCVQANRVSRGRGPTTGSHAMYQAQCQFP